MIFPNNANGTSISASPQFFNPAAVSFPFAYNAAQINYRDSSWLKLSICELFLKNECPNIDNCSLAHPPSAVKIENSKVTVCYDFIKKKDCKHGNCKYYHPHDALASAILRRGDDTKKNGNSLSHLGLTLGLRSSMQVPRSQDLLSMQTHGMLSSHMNNNIIQDPHMKAKLEVMRQLNAASAPQAWLPGLNIASAQTLVSPTNQATVSLHSLLSGVSAKSSIFHPIGSLLSTAGSSIRPTMLGMTIDPDLKIAGIKREASEAFGSMANSSHTHASNDNSIYGFPDIKKPKSVDAESHYLSGSNCESAVSSHFYMPTVMSTSSSQLQSSSQVHLAPVNGSNFNIIQANPLQSSPVPGYHQLGSYNINNLFFQSLLANNQSTANANPNLDALLALSGQKIYAPINSYPQINVAQMPLINQLYYQQLLQNSLVGASQIIYPSPINIAELQQRTLEETSVAFINDKGTILETLPVCKDFLQGKCKRSQSCNYVHLLDSNVEIKDSKLTVCKNALKGQCHRTVCKFYHIPTYQLQKLGLHTHSQ